MQKSRFIEIVKNFGKTRVAVLGDFCVDVLLKGKHTKFSRESPAPVNEIRKIEYYPGAAANVAYNLLKLKVGKVAPATIVGNYNQDFMSINFGEILVNLLKKEGADCAGMIESKDRPTYAYLKMMATGEGTSTPELQWYRADLGAAKNIEDNQAYKLLEGITKDVSHIIISDYGKGIVTQTMLDLIGSLKSEFKKIGTARNNIRRFKNFDLLCLNDFETVSAYKNLEEGDRASEEDIRECGQRLLAETGSRNLIVSRGALGMMVFEGGMIYNVPTKPKKVVDITGAGDTTLAAVVAAWGAGATLVEAAKIGNYAAGIVVQKPGTATASQEEILKEIENDE